MSIRDQIEAIDFDAVWDNMLAGLDADGIDTKLLLSRVAENLRRGSTAHFFRLEETVLEETRRSMKTPTTRRQTIRLARVFVRFSAQQICEDQVYKRPLPDAVVDEWLGNALFHADVPVRWSNVFEREYRRALRRVVALVDRRVATRSGPRMIVCVRLPDPNGEFVKAGDLAQRVGSSTVYVNVYRDDTMQRRTWVQAGARVGSR